MQLNIDEALINPAQDCLDRAKFARSVFTVIDGTPAELHARVGIYGPWGSGGK